MAEESAEARITLLERLFCGSASPNAPIPFSWVKGSRLYDMLRSTLPRYLISERMFDKLRMAKATGFSRYSIELRGKANELIDGYGGLAVAGRSGPLQLDRSRVETRIGASGKPYKVKIGLYFDKTTWDGCDVFAPEETTFVFVTDKVRMAIENARMSNVAFIRLSEFERLW